MENSERKKVEEIQEGIQVDKERDRGRKRNQRIKKEGQRREIEDSKKVSRRQTKKERDSRRKRKQRICKERQRRMIESRRQGKQKTGKERNRKE